MGGISYSGTRWQAEGQAWGRAVTLAWSLPLDLRPTFSLLFLA